MSVVICPFCLSDGFTIEQDKYGDEHYLVDCEMCGSSGELEYEEMDFEPSSEEDYAWTRELEVDE